MADPNEIIAYIDQKVLPEELYQYFFIDGERIADLAKPENERDVRNAIEVFVGLRELEDGAKHLQGAAGIFEEELAKHEKLNSELQQIDTKISAKEAEQTRLRDELIALRHTLTENGLEQQAISEELEKNEKTFLLEEQRKGIVQQITHRQEMLQIAESDLFSAAIQDGWTAFALEVASSLLSANLEVRVQ